MSAYIEMKNVVKSYRMGEVTINACDGVHFQVEQGEFVVIVGPSGAGKTTILNILGGMDTPTSGQVIVDGRRVDSFNEKQSCEGEASKWLTEGNRLEQNPT